MDNEKLRNHIHRYFVAVHWPVKEPKKLSDRLAAIYIVYGEVRWYPSYE